MAFEEQLKTIESAIESTKQTKNALENKRSELLLEEANRRYKPGMKVYDDVILTICNYPFEFINNKFECGVYGYYYVEDGYVDYIKLYNNGAWAEIIEDSKEEKPDYSWDKSYKGSGFIITSLGLIERSHRSLHYRAFEYSIYRTEKEAKKARAIAPLSWIIYEANGGELDWTDGSIKYCLISIKHFLLSAVSTVVTYETIGTVHFLSFKTGDIKNEVYAQHKQLIHDYLMID